MSTTFTLSPQPISFDEMLSLKGKIAIVTGGSRGIGEVIVTRFIEAGATVVFTGRDKAAFAKVEAKTASIGGTTIGIQADSSNLDDLKMVVKTTISKFGHIDILVNNAAIFPGSMAMEMTEEVWDKTFDTDAKGAFFLAKFVAQEMIHAGNGGKIINILSTAAFQVAAPLTAYGAAKQALWYTTQAMAQELARHHILVNAVTPGTTMTTERIASMTGMVLSTEKTANENMQNLIEAQPQRYARGFSRVSPIGRVGFPDDIANAVLFLASDSANYITGVNIPVEGGQILRNEKFGMV